MILKEKLIVEIKRANVRFYKDKYKCKVGDIININVSDLPIQSNIKIDVKCDVCFIEKKLSYRKYLKNVKNQGYYSCSSKCSTGKKKISYLEKYGVDNPNKNIEVRNKTKNTCLKKYGVDNPNKNIEVRNKTKNTCLQKYNNETYLNSKYFKNKMKDSYGVDNPMMSSIINNKRVKSSFMLNDFNEIKYQGKYELDFLFFCKNKNIIVERPKFKISYKYLLKEKKYFPDFYIPSLNLIIEIKSTYYYNLHKEKNDRKREYCIASGYDFIFILDKNYDEFKNLYITI